MAKTLSVVIQQLSAVSFKQSQGVTLESESTCSRVPLGLRRDWQACQQATWNTWVGKTASQSAVAHMCYRCLNQLFVVLSFHFGLGPIKKIERVELRQWVHLRLCHFLHPEADLSAQHSWVCSLPPCTPKTVQSDVVKNPHMQVYKNKCMQAAYWLAPCNIEKEDAAAHRGTFLLENVTILMIYRS